MSKSKKAKENFLAICEEKIGNFDRWGNYKITTPKDTYRIKINKTSWRFEVKIIDRWSRIAGAYYFSDKSEKLINGIANKLEEMKK